MKKANDIRWIMRNILKLEFFKIMVVCAIVISIYLTILHPNKSTAVYYTHWLLIIYIPLFSKIYCQLRALFIVLRYLKIEGESAELAKMAANISAKDFSKITRVDPLVSLSFGQIQTRIGQRRGGVSE